MASEIRSTADAIDALCEVDGRPGAPALWSAVVRRAVELQRGLRLYAGGAEDEAEAAAVGALEEMFVAPAHRLGDARNGVLVTPGGDDVGLAVQAPTEIHRELAVACTGGGDAETWRVAVAAWARRRRASEAASELQDWGVAAVAVRQRRRPRPISGAVTRTRSGPRLEGVRVIEMGGLWAAPYAAQLLRGLGADVIKIEAPTRPDGTRFGPIAHFEALNAGKRMLALDLRRDDDRETLLGLVGPGSVVIENFTGRVLANLGLPPAMLLERGAAIVRLPASRSALDLRAFGSLIELAGGLHLTDRRGHPTCAPIPFTDALAGVTGALAAIRALRDGRHRLRIVGQLEDVAGPLVR